MKLDHEQVETVLRALIRSLNYGLHKDLQNDPIDGRDWYSQIAAEFIGMYETFE